MGAFLPPDELQRRYDAYLKHGTYSGAAAELGVSESNVRRAVKVAVSKNMGGDFVGETLPEGYTMGKVTRLVGPEGIMMEWQHQLPDVEAVQEAIDTLIAAMQADITPLPSIERTERAMSGDLTVYPIADVHLGQYSWAKEVGHSYDLDIAKAQYLRSVGRLMSLSPNSEEGLVVLLGDFFHADNNDATTHRSGNHLDVDGRHDKVLHAGTELAIWTIDMALAKHERVTVHVSKGNHDEYAATALGMALWFRYQGNERVVIDRSPAELWTKQWGKTMLAFTHGHQIKAEDMPGVMAAYEPEIWGNTEFRYGYSGHFHRSKKGPLSDEKHGATWEIVPAFTEKDAWNKAMGHASQRGLLSKTFNRNEGLTSTINVQVR